MKIATKLGAGFGLVLTLLCAGFVVGLSSLSVVNRIVVTTIDEDWVEVHNAFGAELDQTQDAVSLLQLCLEPDPAKRARINRDIDAQREQISKELDLVENQL